MFPANILKSIQDNISVSVEMYITAEKVLKLVILYLAVLKESRKKAWMYIGTYARNAVFKKCL